MKTCISYIVNCAYVTCLSTLPQVSSHPLTPVWHALLDAALDPRVWQIVAECHKGIVTDLLRGNWATQEFLLVLSKLLTGQARILVVDVPKIRLLEHSCAVGHSYIVVVLCIYIYYASIYMPDCVLNTVETSKLWYRVPCLSVSDIIHRN